jgi:hypothetical protein
MCDKPSASYITMLPRPLICFLFHSFGPSTLKLSSRTSHRIRSCVFETAFYISRIVGFGRSYGLTGKKTRKRTLCPLHQLLTTGTNNIEFETTESFHRITGTNTGDTEKTSAMSMELGKCEFECELNSRSQ